MTAGTTVELGLARIASPIGTVLLVCRDDMLCALEFADCEERMLRGLRSRFREFRLLESSDPGGIAARLDAYFAGSLDVLTEIAVDGGGTSFQRTVWGELRLIRPGEVSSYGALARRLGMPKAIRAVGRANALNPISIVVPCHRLIGANGALTGYGGGLERKRWLLEHEGIALQS